MNAQEIFNKAYWAVLDQGVQSKDDDGGCLYRGPCGSKCAAGHLIDDAHYDFDLEGAAIMNESLERSDRVTQALEWSEGVAQALESSGVSREHLPLVRDLQIVHDGLITLDGCMLEYEVNESNFVEHWKDGCVEVAARYGLTVPTGR